MKLIIKLIFATLCLSASSLSAADLIIEKPALTLDGAKLIASHATAKAHEENWNVIIAIVDSHGYLTYLERMGSVQLASLDVAIGKAKTSVLYARSTQLFEERIKAGDDPVTMLSNITAFSGGVPIKVNGHIIGAIGVSGVRSNQDAIIAQAGVDAFLTHIENTQK